ncbi:MAG: threonine ammonia-lyase [Candidatus Nanopelagicales bacterium]|nr:threonine ammonia-lyase [Candidatus Nanopelagicales bacterium]MCF8539159.1 threonine ammonia-lyase [Candidatus Nanopelagicales bacterium]MCF8550951.1 threonine ammonia-lyase [Candidatus Nanopelagicales bacterium]
MTHNVTVADIEQARETISGVINQLPIANARWLTEMVGGPVYLVPENLQRAGSFKIRGAFNRLSRLTSEEKARGVVAASAGNHAQGVALAAQTLGIKSTVFMPIGATIPKVEATKGYGADVEFFGTSIDEALTAAQEFADRTGAILIHPFNHEDIVAGQGTLGLEIMEKIPDVATVVLCTGGGGLLAGVALAIKSVNPHVTVIGVQAEEAAAYPASLAAGKPIALEKMSTMADGIAVGRPGDIPFAIISENVDEIITVSEDELSYAALSVLERAKMVVEPAGAAATAAVMADPTHFTPPVAVVLSGGNVDSLLLLRIIRHGMTAGGRYLTMQVQVPDAPGSLASLLRIVQEMSANVVEVDHNRIDPTLGVHEVEIDLQVETRGREHADAVLAAIREQGFEVTEL